MTRTNAALLILAWAWATLAQAEDAALSKALAGDGECDQSDEACSLNALQVKVEKASADVQSSQAEEKALSGMEGSEAEAAEFGPFVSHTPAPKYKTSQCCLCNGRVSFSPSGYCRSCNGHIDKQVTPQKSCRWDGGFNKQYVGKKRCRQMCATKYFSAYARPPHGNPYNNPYYNPYAPKPPFQNPYYHKPSQCCQCNGRVMFSPNGECSKCHGKPQKTLTPKKICNWDSGYNKVYKGKKFCLQMCQTKYFPHYGY